MPRPKGEGPWVFLGLEGACKNNIKGIDVSIPLGVMACVSGVSGSGKSTLIHEILVSAVEDHLSRSSSLVSKKYYKRLKEQIRSTP